MYTESTQIR